MKGIYSRFLVLIFLIACSPFLTGQAPPKAAPACTFAVVRVFPQWIDLAGLLSPIYRLSPEAVLNGIAYDPIRKRLFVTGKLWPSIFEIKLSPKAQVVGVTSPFH
jgi:hypothetical protein